MKKTIIFFSFLYILCNYFILYACTGITLQAGDGAVVFGRTLEWSGPLLNSDIIIVPRGQKYTGSTPSETSGLEWEVKYAFVGMNATIMKTFVIDGINEKGLTAGAFYFKGYAGYLSYKESFAKKSLAPEELSTWILSNFTTVAEVKKGLQKVRVAPVVLKAWGLVLPLHFIVTDPTGESIVIEYVKGKLNTYDNPVGAMANSPTFDWHLTNIRNYIGLTPWNKPPSILGKKTFKSFSSSGMFGIPGDFTSPSRFIRATFFSKNTLPGKNADEAVKKVFHVLNQFDIPKGIVRSKIEKLPVIEITEWTAASDTKNKRYYFHTVSNRSIRMIDLNKIDLNAKKIITVPVYSVKGKVEDITPKIK